MELWYYNDKNGEAKRSNISEEQAASDIDGCWERKNHFGFSIYYFQEAAA
jgi:hypothetical protein